MAQEPVATSALQALRRAKYISLTTYRRSGIRVAPHGYNTFEEIDALVDGVKRYRKEVACSP